MTTTQPLSAWDRKQAALLYHFSSINYLKLILDRLNDIIRYIDGSLDDAKIAGRDTELLSKRWGARDTSENWANNAWPFLADFQKSLAHNISNRSFEIYSTTGINHCARGLAEFSLLWMDPGKCARFEKMFADLSKICIYLDYTVDKARSDSTWTDFSFASVWSEYRQEFRQIPKLQLRTDITCATGMIPSRTGVYVPINDPYGAAQFGWAGGGRGELLLCKTLNELGKEALDQVGRDRLWIDNDAMFKFATLDKHKGRFDAKMKVVDVYYPHLAASAIAREAFTAVAREWCYVEVVNGEFDDIDDTLTTAIHPHLGRVAGGNPCPQSGYYFTPVSAESRRFFNQGEHMPELNKPMGKTIWQWDERQ